MAASKNGTAGEVVQRPTDYDGPADVPGEVARQYTSAGRVPGFAGDVDLNVAPVGPWRLARQLGLGTLVWRG